MGNNPLSKFLLLFILLPLSGCIQLFPCEWEKDYDRIENKIDPSEIIGVYKINELSRNHLSGFPSLLKILPSNRYKFLDRDNKIIKSGKWSYTCGESFGCLIELTGITVEELGKKGNNLAILISLGDPDSCDGIAYDKIK